MTRVPRRPKVSKRRHVDGKTRREQQGETQRLIDQGIIALVIRVIQQALRQEVTRLLGRAKGERRDLRDKTAVEACCNRCGSRYRREFYRAGFYLRGLLTLTAWGRIRVPRVSCSQCGGMVDFEFAHLVPYGRLWFDLEERARELAAMCVSLRDGVRGLSWQSGQPVCIATLNGMVNRAGELAKAFHAGVLERIPAVVMVTGCG